MQLLAVDGAHDTAGPIADIVDDRRPGSLGVATGSSPEPTYRELIRRGSMSTDTDLYLVDEYLGLAPGNPLSYRAVIAAQLAEPCGGLRIIGPDVHARDPDAAAVGYEDVLGSIGGVDLQLLGIGRNGHIGFNEPGTPFSSRTRVAALSTATRIDNARFFTSLADVPTRCITQGLATIMMAAEIVLIATGAAKASALATLLTRPPHVDVPASALLAHPNVTLVADRAARSLVPEHVWPARAVGRRVPHHHTTQSNTISLLERP